MTTDFGATLMTPFWSQVPIAVWSETRASALPANTTRLALYLVTIVFGGLVHDYRLDSGLLHVFKYRNPNTVHIAFVKKGWPYITFCVHTWLTVISCLLLIHQQQSLIKIWDYLKRKYLRFTLFILIWFFTQEAFDFYLLTTSYCDSNENIDEFGCVEDGFKWHAGFDISGHVFVLVLSNLVLLEESRLIHRWLIELITDHCESSNKLDSPEVARREIKYNSPKNEPPLLFDDLHFTNSPNLKTKKLKPSLTLVSPASKLDWSIDEYELDSSMDIRNVSDELCPVGLSLLRYVLLRLVPGVRLAASSVEFLWHMFQWLKQQCYNWILLQDNSCKRATLSATSLHPLVLFTWLAIRAVSLVYDLMLLQTIFFYHTTTEKVISFCWTLLCCRMIYKSAPSEPSTDSGHMPSLTFPRYHHHSS